MRISIVILALAFACPPEAVNAFTVGLQKPKLLTVRPIPPHTLRPVPWRPSPEIGFSYSSTPAEGASSEPDEGSSDEVVVSEVEDTSNKKELEGFRKRISSYFKSSDKDDGLTFRQRLAKMGLATVLSYGWISNTNATILIAIAWYIFSLQTGLSPFYPQQWKPFLGVYAGFYVVSNFLRPFRISLAIMVGPYFERLVNWIQDKTKLPKAGAVTVTVFLVNLVGTTALMLGGISLASVLSGVPVFPPKALLP